MPRIKRVLSCPVRVPLDNPPAMAGWTIPARHFALVRVECDDGSYGIGFCHVGAASPKVVTDFVRESLSPLLVGVDPYEVERLWEAMYRHTLMVGRVGLVLRAISAVDTALWDRNARAAGVPLWKYLGAAKSTSVPAYASGGYYRPGKGPAELAQEVGDYVKAGFGAAKIKVGGATPEEDEERLAAVRERVGPDILVMLDANNAWNDLPTALRAMRRFEKYDPYWIEEPFSPDDIDNHRRLAERTPVLVATGEIEGARWRHKELLVQEAAAILQTDALVCGGVTEFRRIAATASSFGIAMAPHAFHHVHVHLVAATPNAQFVEYFVDNSVVNFPLLASKQFEAVDGALALPTGDGLGFDYQEGSVRQWAMEPWS